MEIQKNYVIYYLFAIYIINTNATPISKLMSADKQRNVIQVLEGSTIELNCTADGSTRPSIINWLHDGHLVEQAPTDMLSVNTMAPVFDGGKVYSTTTIGRLVIHNVSKRHSGKYTCVADTENNRETKSYTIEVTGDGKLENERSEQQLRIYQISTMIIQNENRPFYAICRATQGVAKSSPIIKWTLGDRILTDDAENGIKIHNNGDLEVSVATIDYQFNNELSCHAYGDNGQVVSEGVFLYLMG